MNIKDISNNVVAPSLPHRRRISQEEQNYLAKICTMAFKAEINEKVVERLMSHINFVEKKMIGRMASHIEDLVIHYLMRYFSSMNDGLDEGVHLEIGTLFGGTVLIAHHAVTMAEKKVPIHVIDPFGGYYGKGNDIITGEEISEETFLKNLDALGIPHSDVVIHKGLSTDAAMIEECQSLRLRSLLIDGDHSYSGIKNDWINFSHLVVPGGYVMIDNYNDFYWPDVMSYVNKEILPNTRGKWEVLLVYANSLLLRRTDVLDDDDAAYSMKLYREIREREAKCASQIAQLESFEKAHREEIASLIAAHDASKETAEELQASIAESEKAFKTESDRLLAQLSQTSQSVESLQKEKDEFKGQAQHLQEELASLRAKYEEESCKNQIQRKSTVESIEKLAQMQKMTEELRETHRQEILGLHKELQKTSEAHRQEILRLQEAHGKVLSEQIARSEALQSELTGVVQESAQLRSDLAVTRKSYADETSLQKEQIRQLQAGLHREAEALTSGYSQRLVEWEAEVQNLRLRIDRQDESHRDELTRMETVMRQAESAYRETVHTLQARLSEAEQADALLKNDLLRLEKERTELAAIHAAEVEKMTSTMQEAIADHRKHRDDLEKKLASSVDELRAVRDRMQREKEELQGASALEASRLSAQIATLEAELRERDNRIRDLLESVSWKITSPLRTIGKTFSGKGKQS